VEEFDKIFLIWRKGKGHQRFIIGELFQFEGIYKFKYLPKAKELEKEGFITYTEFQDLNKIYDKNILQIFGQRLTKSTRPDIKTLYDFWDVDVQKTEDIFYMLGKTQALLATDNFEFIPEYKSRIPLSFVTEVAGLSYHQIPKDSIKVKDTFQLERELTNSYDKDAIKVFAHNKHIGYIKIVHSSIIANSDLSNVTIKVKAIDQNGIIKRIFVTVLIKV
jgi:hypothetical protein